MCEDAVENASVETGMRVSKLITTPKGGYYRAAVTGSTMFLANVKNPNQTVIVTGGSVTEALSISGILDGLGDALQGLLKLVTCRPITTTVVNVGSDGKITSVVTTTTCAPS